MITIYSKDNCPKCSQAIMYCDVKGVDYEIKKLGVDYDRDEAIKISGGKLEMPIIVVNDVYIGSFDGLKKHLSSIN